MPPKKKRKKTSESEKNESDEKYIGEMKDGKYDGRGTLIYNDSNVRFEGRFKNGEKNGKGTLYFEDDESLSGVWKNDQLQGEGTYIFSDGSYLIGNYVDGELNGKASEYTSSGILIFEGEYESNFRQGKGKLYFEKVPNSGYIEGNWNQGILEGDAIYYYPDGTSLQGKWEDGNMKSARLFQNERNKFMYYFDPSTSSQISSDPTIPDPYEENLVYVKKSNMEGAGEGLFAKKDIESGVVVSFYNGIRLTHKLVDSRAWSENNNTISLNDDVVIDVPKEWNDINKYKASLGHKANHSQLNNAKYDKYNHPRFGEIKCIRKLNKDEEITVDYGYKKGTGPTWYRQLIKDK